MRRGKVLKMMGSPDYEAELKEIIDSIHLERSCEVRAAVPVEVPAADFSGRIDRDVQPALRHQRDSLLRERHFRGGRIQRAFRRTGRQ